METIYILLLNNGEHYEDFKEWVGGVFTSRADAVANGKARTGADYFNVEKWEIGKERYSKCWTYEFSNTTRKWTA